MPRMDGTGPAGSGPRTGWGRGYCAGGLRAGRRRGFQAGWRPGFSAMDDRQRLEAEANFLEGRLEEIRQRLRGSGGTPETGGAAKESESEK